MNKIFLLLFCVCGILGVQVNAQTPADKTDDMSDMLWKMDSLMAHFHYKPSSEEMDSLLLNKHGFPTDSVPAYSPTIYAQRLRDLSTRITMDYNPYVDAFIKVYVRDRREQVKRMLGLQHVFFPIFEEVFDRENLPIELKYLAVVESALNPHAKSRVGATGLWQFMYATGKIYRLEVDSYVDERRDPVKSTEAAAKYFKQMYRIYGDWLLVIAAYNCGPGNVNKAIRRSGGKTNFWEIREFLPRETRGYVPAFIAATYAMNYATEHNLYPIPLDFSYDQDTVHITRQEITLSQIAELSGTDFYTLKDLNPELKTQTIPYSGKPYVLRVPYKTAEQFTLHRDSIYKLIANINPDSLSKLYSSSDKVSPITRQTYTAAVSPSGSSYSGSQGKSSTGNGNLIYYKVKNGDVISLIAEKHHVTWVQIRDWNNLKGYNIKPGQSLKIYVSDAFANSSPAPKPKTEPVMQDGKKFHKVQSGDTLWDIAKKYDGLTVTRLKELNNLDGNGLKPGQLLMVE